MPETAAAREQPSAAVLLGTVSEAFAAAPGDVTLAIQAVCDVVAARFDDAVVVRILGPDGGLPLVGVGATRPGLAADIIETFEHGDAPPVVADVLDGGPATIVPRDSADKPALLRDFEARVGYCGSLIAPLRVRGEAIGTLSVICTQHPEGHDERDLELLAELADRCAIDIDNARLLDQLNHELGERSLAERRHAALLHHTSDIILVVSRTGRVLDVTPSIERVLGVAPADLLRGSMFDIVELADRARVARELRRSTEEPGPTSATEFRVRHLDGSTRWLEVTANNLLEDPAVAAVVITARDVTDRHLAAELLAAENRLLQEIVGETALKQVLESLCRLVETRIKGCIASVWLLEGDDRLAIQAAPSIDLGIVDKELVLSAEHIGILGPEHPPVLTTVVGVSKEWEGFEEEAAAFGIAGSWSRAVVEPNGEVHGSIVLFFLEVTEPTPDQIHVLELATHLAGLALSRERSSRAMSHAATHDALTGLPNRSLFLDQLARVLARSGADGEVAVIFVDLDDFKMVNDTSGHAVGDLLLREAAARLAGVVRPLDVIARLGGDEFAVLCDGLGVTEAGAVARRAIEALDDPFDLDGRHFHVSASAGIAVGNARTSPDSVLRDADTAMYQAKREGRGRYAVFTPAVREATVRRLSLEQDLRDAIERAELSVHFQPVVCLHTGALLGLEGLARWTSEAHGSVSPVEFIELAERTGMITALGTCILRQAVERAAAWRTAGLIGEGVTVAVNVAAQQLADPNFVPTVLGALEEFGLPTTGLCLELTESAVMADVEVAQGTLGLLRTLGVTLAIDDFGTGHSSLARLRSLDATVLKLDRMFILDLEEDERSVEMVQSVVHLAHALGKRLVVEGVELPTQLNILRRLGVDAAQGFYLGRPQPAEAMEGFLRINASWDVGR